jgi:hypothetical protein
MDTRKLRWTHRGVCTVGIFSWALLVIPATDAWAITFGEWATNQGWLFLLTQDCIIIEVEKGDRARRRASRFRYVGD